MQGAIRIGDVSVAPGEQRSIELSLPSFYSHSPVIMPVHVINGRRDGPVLFVSAAIHGDEINGVEIIRRLLKARQIQRLKGALIAVPVVNVYGFISQSRYLPDRRDLNRSFPGSETGSMAARLAFTFMHEVVSQCTHGIDLHTGAIGRENLPQIRAKVFDAPQTAAMACAFGAPVILNAELRDGSLRAAVAEHGIPVLLYEAGEALRFDEVAIRAGVKGITRVMRHLGMLAKSKSRKAATEPLVARNSHWVRAPQSGVLRMVVPLGAQVSKQQIIGRVADPFGEQEEVIRADESGIVIGKTNLPLVHEGEAVFHIARFKQPKSATESVEAFQEEHDPLGDSSPGQEPVIV
ncbi:MAG: succinylglutamate desuccinylase/aspartoacylase family protein [Proteobacteria bacterium]|nr:succinylglutamate desuccinylase/aspartoacylase family protein [Pseudomonadota bacterium]